MNKRICLNQSVLDFMASKLTRDSFVLEFGAGWSSRWFAERCGRLISVETSPMWARMVREDLEDALCACDWEVKLSALPHVMVPHLGNVDLVLVDCDERYRAACVEAGWRVLKPGGWLVFDDAQRLQHAPVAGRMSAQFPAVALRWAPGDIETARERLALAWQKPV